MAESEIENATVSEGEGEGFTSPRLKRARRLLGLPEQPPNVTGMLYIPIYGRPGIGGRLGSLSDEEREREVERYHAEDFRARVATTLADVPPHVRSQLANARHALTHYRAQRALASARVLRYTSHYIHPRDDKEIDGYFDFGSDHSFSLAVCTADIFRRHAQYEWKHGDLVHSENTTVLGGWCPWLMVPGKRLDDQLIAEAILRWYKDRFQYVQGHWSQRERRLPQVIVNLHWESDDEERERVSMFTNPRNSHKSGKGRKDSKSGKSSKRAKSE
jgi:hypothetical protein